MKVCTEQRLEFLRLLDEMAKAGTAKGGGGGGGEKSASEPGS